MTTDAERRVVERFLQENFKPEFIEWLKTEVSHNE